MPDPEEIVDAKFVPSDRGAVFSYSTWVEQKPDFNGTIKYGDVVRVRRLEAEQRSDFVIVGEESTTSGTVIRQESQEGSVVASPPATQTDEEEEVE